MKEEDLDEIIDNLENAEFNNEEEDMNIIEEEEEKKPIKNNNKLLIGCFIIIGILLLIIILFICGVFKSGGSESKEPKPGKETPIEVNDKTEKLTIADYSSSILNDNYVLLTDGTNSYITDYDGNVVYQLEGTDEVHHFGKVNYLANIKDGKIVIRRIDKDMFVDVLVESKDNFSSYLFDDNNTLIGIYKNNGNSYDLYLIENNSTREIQLKNKVLNPEDMIIYAGRYVTVIEDTKYGVYDIKDNKYTIPASYEYIKYLNGDRFVALKNNKLGLIDKNNNVLLEFKYDAIDYSNGLYFAGNGDTLNVLNNNLVEFNDKIMVGNLQKYTIRYTPGYVAPFRLMNYKDYVIVFNNNKISIVNKEGKITELDYSYAKVLYNYLVLNKDGSKIVALYDSKLNKVQEFDGKTEASYLVDSASIYLDTNFLLDNKLYDMKTGSYKFAVNTLNRSYKGYTVTITVDSNIHNCNAIVKLEETEIGSIQNIDLLAFLKADNNGIKVTNNYFILSVGERNLIIKI